MAELERLSHSSAHTYGECGERWRLERVEKADKIPWLAGPAGSAFHTMTEVYDTAGVDALEVGTYETYLIEELLQDGVAFVEGKPDLDGYRLSRGETFEWWCRAGDHMFTQYVEWRERSGWTIWESPFEPEWDSEGGVTNGWMMGVELPFEVMLPGMTVPDVGYIDRIYLTPEGKVILIDLKTWFRERSTTQLPHYFAVAKEHLGIPVDGVGYYDARLGRPTGLMYPSENPEIPWDTPRLTGLLLPVERGIMGDVFEPKPGRQCGWCSVAHHCAYKENK